MTFSEAVKTCLTEKYFKISGRATRSEYWWFQLFIYLVVLTLGISSDITGWNFLLGIVGLFYILTLIPSICVLVRRLHDAGFLGWFAFISLVPYVGGIVLLVMTLRGSDGDNKWGPNPQQQLNTPIYTSME